MATPVRKWVEGKVAIAVESDKDQMNKEYKSEGPHVHVYIKGVRTKARIPGNRENVDAKDYQIAEKLFDKYYYEIKRECEKVVAGCYGD